MSHTNLLYHIVCGTKERRPLINPEWEDRLFAYLGGITRGSKGRAIEINGVEDHVHLLVRLGPTIAVADYLRELKSESSRLVRKEIDQRFGWGARYGAFSVSESNVPQVRAYIKNQKIHHRRVSFEDEFRELLLKNNVDFDERYLWG